MNKCFFETTFLCLIAVCVIAQAFGQGRIDTTFYNKEGKGVPNIGFSDYYRIAFYPSDDNYKKQFRDYYNTGQLKTSGNFVMIDKYDDVNSIFDGTIDNYYANGKIANHYTLIDGNLNGDYMEYNEEGYVMMKGSFKNGAKHGQFIMFLDDGSAAICEFTNDKQANDYIRIMPDGHKLKLRCSDNKPIWNTPNTNEQKSIKRNGITYGFYDNNGLVVANKVSIESDIYTGKWWKIHVLISNNSNVPIKISDENIRAIVVKEKNQSKTNCDIYSRDRYIRRLKQAQNTAMIFAAIGNGVASATAGYSSTQTNTSTSYVGSSYSSGSGSAYGSGGSAYGSYYDNTIYSGYSYTTSNSVTYNGYAAYQAQILANEQMSQLSDSFWWKRTIADAGYLKSNTLLPDESISGYVYAKSKGGFKGRSIYVTIKIEGAEYRFGWGK